MTTRFVDHLLTGDHASRPAFGSVPQGTLYACSDHGLVYQSDGVSAWSTWATLGGGAPAAHAASHESGGSDEIDATGLVGVGGGSGAVVQVVNVQTGAGATGTTIIPHDDTIPQNTEGTEFMTLAVTPTDAANILKIDVVFIGSCATAARNLIAALFQDTTANAIAVGWETPATGTYVNIITFTHYMVAGTTSATTFKVRAGVEVSGTVTFNGSSGARKFGGVAASSITITEIVP